MRAKSNISQGTNGRSRSSLKCAPEISNKIQPQLRGDEKNNNPEEPTEQSKDESDFKVIHATKFPTERPSLAASNAGSKLGMAIK